MGGMGSRDVKARYAGEGIRGGELGQENEKEENLIGRLFGLKSWKLGCTEHYNAVRLRWGFK